ncbi:Pex19 protein family-domain-containing protein [Cercophora samala]|uniref:Pex19 protein family-domain-containing protein n=1 Tax=Cercophora samala TaxID=330535 RepID=A0AA39ZJ68_9PEZI|nr:Pex19 protein family-domain-containing protein [Cercophora samala]
MSEQQTNSGAAPAAAVKPDATLPTTTTTTTPAATVTAPVQDEKKAVTVEDVADDDDIPDPDEDDLDDLDDMLEEFNAVKLDSKPPAAAAAPSLGPERPPAIPGTGDDLPLDEDEFARQLQAGMADLLGEIESSPEMQAQFESIFKELGAAASASAAVSPDPKSPSPGPATAAAPTPPVVPPPVRPPSSSGGGAEASFQETIRRTMERMQTSGEQATAAAAAEGSDDFLAELLKQMQAGGGGLGDGLGGEGSEEEFSKMLLGMMEQLTNKEILYEPMKELHDKFPEWLEKNKDKTPPEDLKRYEEQQGLVAEIVGKFEEAGYSDEKAADREYIVDRMQKMQASGQPPADLVGDMPSTQDALAMPDEGCAPQ